MTAKNKKNVSIFFPKKIIPLVLLFVILSFSPIKPKLAHACWWGDAQCTKVFDELRDRIEGVIMTTLDQQAARILNEQMNKLVGGGYGIGARFITNWESFLVTEPERQARAFANAKIDQALRGRGSYSMYIPRSYALGSVLGASDSKANEGFFGGGKVLGDSSECASDSECPSDQSCVNGTCVFKDGGSLSSGDNYYGSIQSAGQSAISDQEPKVTYEGNPSQMFSDPNKKWQLFNIYVGGINNRWGMNIYATSLRLQAEQQYTMINITQGQAYGGYLPTMRNGIVTTPGSTIAQAVANVQDIGNKIIAAAKHPEQIVTAVVTNVISKALQVGIGVVDRQINQMTDKALYEVNGQLNKFGPGALYNNGLRRY